MGGGEFGTSVISESAEKVLVSCMRILRMSGGGDLSGRMSYPFNNDSLRYVLINEGMSGSTTSYYERAHDSDLLAC